MIKLYICCLVLIIGSVEVGLDIDIKFHQEVMEIVSYDIIYTAAMFLSTYPIDLIIWTTAVGLPLNSILNPSVFIIISIRKYIKERRLL